MSTAIQSQRLTRHAAGCWALGLALLLAAALSLLLLRPIASSPESIPLVNSSEFEAVSYVEVSVNAPPPESVSRVRNDESAVPLFGLETAPLLGGEVVEKWSRAQAEIADELQIVDRCRSNGPCPAVAQRLIDLSGQGGGQSGRARVGLINRAVALAISLTADEAQWGMPDHWSPPFETLRSGRGDCEDYAIVKYLALLVAGISEDDVKIVILKNAFPIEDHAVVAVRVDREWLVLDNRTLRLVRDRDLTRATPELVLDQKGVKRLVSRSRSKRSAG
jgi:predicted transglutaminase-like cysteine proteinase